MAAPPRKRRRGDEHYEPHGHEAFAAVVSVGKDPARVARARDVILADWDEDETIIVDVFVKSVCGLPTRLPAFAALAAACGSRQAEVGERLCSAVFDAYAKALRDFDWVSVKATLRFLALLAREGVVPADYVAPVLRSFAVAAAGEATDLSFRKDTFAGVAMAVCPWVASSQAGIPHASAVVEELQTYMSRRRRCQSVAAFRPVETLQFNFIQHPSRITPGAYGDYLQQMWAELTGLRSSGWNVSRVIPEAPVPGATPGWTWASPPPLPTSPPDHEAAAVYMDFPTALHIYARWDPVKKAPCGDEQPEHLLQVTGSAELTAAQEEMALFSKRLSLPLGERLVLRELAGDLLFSCNANREVLEKQLAGLPLAGSEERESVGTLVVETVLGWTLCLPRPPFSMVYYSAVLADLCKGKESVYAVGLVEALDTLHDRIVEMDPELCDRMVQMFAFHMNNFSLKWIWDDWVEAVRSKENQGVATARKLFLFELFTQMVRNAEHSRVLKSLPTTLRKYVPRDADPRKGFRYAASDAPLKSEADVLLARIRAPGFGSDEAVKYLEGLPEGVAPEEALDMLMHCILFAGSDCVSHERHLVTRFAPALRKVSEDVEGGLGGVKLILALNSFWDCGVAATGSVQGKRSSLQNLLDSELCTPLDTVRWALSDGVSSLLERSFIWELLDQGLSHGTDKVLGDAEDLVDLTGAMAELEASSHPEEAKEKARRKLQKAIAQKTETLRDKPLFDLRRAFVALFQGLCELIQKREQAEREEILEHQRKEGEAKEKGKAPPKSVIAGKSFIWRRSTLGHLNAIGRKFLPFLLPCLDALHEEVFATHSAPAVAVRAFYDWRFLRGARPAPLKGTFCIPERAEKLQRVAFAKLAMICKEGESERADAYQRLDAGFSSLSDLLPPPKAEPTPQPVTAVPPSEVKVAPKDADEDEEMTSF
eukprot:Hpha_TRINITY_DN2813_c0_g1::TRINITY_DN2813_c0_g1_i1::g.171538::m.171538/K12882/NCBP1, CBP80; nuclear cap-binding protein subunit 1